MNLQLSFIQNYLYNKNSENKLGEYKMGSQKEVNIEPIKGTLNDYVIKDKDKIVVGRFTIAELDKENKRSTIRFKFYRENNYELLKDIYAFVRRLNK